MRVLFVTEYLYLPERIGGTERNTQALCRRLETMGVTTAVLSKLTRSGWSSVVHRIARKFGAANRRYADRFAGHRTYRVWNIAQEVDLVIRSFQPDIVVLQHSVRPNLADLFVDRGIPVIVYYHDVYWRSPTPPLRMHPLLSVVACSQFVAARLRAERGLDAAVVLPLIEVDDYQTFSTRQEVLFVSLLDEKGADIAWALAKAHPKIRFRFVEGTFVRPLRHDENVRRAKALGNVIIEGPQQNMRQFYARAKVLLAPSLCEEGYGRTVAEAQVSGIPALCSNQGGLPESAGPGAILLSIEQGIAQWSDALSRLWEDNALYQRLSDAAMRHAQRPEFAPEQTVSNLLGHIERLLGREKTNNTPELIQSLTYSE